MRNVTRNLFGVLALAGWISVATTATAAEQVQCSVMKSGKQTTQMVESQAACQKLGGTVISKSKHWNDEHTPAKLQHKQQK